MKKTFALLFLLLSIISHLSGQDLKIEKLHCYIDSSRTENISTILAKPLQAFSEIPFSYGMPQTTLPFWFKLTIHNSSSKEVRAVLSLSQGMFNELKVYSGENYTDIDSTGLKNEYNVLPSTLLNLKPGENIVYAEFTGIGGAYRLDFDVETDKSFIKRESKLKFNFGIYYGLLIVIMIINLFYWLTLKKHIFGYYALFVMMAIFNNSGIDGLPFLNIFGHFGFYSKHIVLLSILIYIGLTPLVSIEYLQIKHKYPKLYKAAIFGLVFTVISVVFTFIFPSNEAFEGYFRYHNLTLIYDLVLTIIIAIKGIKEKNILSRSLILAFSMLILAIVITQIETNGLINTGIAWHAMKIGSILEILILSLSLAMHFKRVEVSYNQVQRNYSDLEDSFLRMQMNPHFLFNVLGSIQNKIIKNEKEGALELVNKFSQMVRNVVDHSKEELVPMDQEITFLKNYIDLQSKNLNEPFTLNVNIDPLLNTENLLLPNMIIQPFVENAILHGLAPVKGRDLKLEINFTNKGEYLLCTVKDNGVGINTQKITNKSKKSVGMTNARERLEKLSKKHNTIFHITSSDLTTKGEQGTLIEIELPLEEDN